MHDCMSQNVCAQSEQTASCPQFHDLYSFVKVSSAEGLDHVKGPECRTVHSVAACSFPLGPGPVQECDPIHCRKKHVWQASDFMTQNRRATGQD